MGFQSGDRDGRRSQSVCHDGDAGEILSCIHRIGGAEATPQLRSALTVRKPRCHCSLLA